MKLCWIAPKYILEFDEKNLKYINRYKSAEGDNEDVNENEKSSEEFTKNPQEESSKEEVSM